MLLQNNTTWKSKKDIQNIQRTIKQNKTQQHTMDQAMCTKWRKLEISTKTDTPIPLIETPVAELEASNESKLLFSTGLT